MKVHMELPAKEAPERVTKFDLHRRGPAPTGAAAANGGDAPPETTHAALDARRQAAKAARNILSDPEPAGFSAQKTGLVIGLWGKAF